MYHNKSQQYSSSQKNKSERIGGKYRQKVKNQLLKEKIWNDETSLLRTEHLLYLFCLGAKFLEENQNNLEREEMEDMRN